MKAHDLAKLLLSMPNDEVEVNDNNGGEIYAIDYVDHFEAASEYPAQIMIQVNCN